MLWAPTQASLVAECRNLFMTWPVFIKKRGFDLSGSSPETWIHETTRIPLARCNVPQSRSDGRGNKSRGQLLPPEMSRAAGVCSGSSFNILCNCDFSSHMQQMLLLLMISLLNPRRKWNCLRFKHH